MLFLVMVAVLALIAFGFEGRLSPSRPDRSWPAAVPGGGLRSDRPAVHSYIQPVDRR
jgi:hypothetical protein